MIYFDNASTTIIDEQVENAFCYAVEKFIGNPSSAHKLGIESKEAIEKTRLIVANYLNVDKKTIYFTSNATESNNLAIISSVPLHNQVHIVTTKIEHSSILKPILNLKKKGNKVDYLALDKNGKIILENLTSLITNNTAICCISAINNEIGTIQEITKIGKIIKKINPNILYIVDAVQAIGHLKIDVKKSKIDFLTFSGHKIYGPKGIGVLYARKKIKNKLILGGSQENNCRAGTENVYAIYALGTAISKLYDYEEKYKMMRSYIVSELKKRIPNCFFINEKSGASHILSITIPEIPASYIVNYLSEKNIYVSTAAACVERTKEYSYVLANLYSKKIAISSFRVSFGKYNNLEECKIFVEELDKCCIDYYKVHSLGKLKI